MQALIYFETNNFFNTLFKTIIDTLSAHLDEITDFIKIWSSNICACVVKQDNCCFEYQLHLSDNVCPPLIAQLSSCHLLFLLIFYPLQERVSITNSTHC